MQMRWHRSIPLLFLVLAACSATAPEPTDSAQAKVILDTVAADYVHLALAVDVHYPGYVDAYYGPTAWRTEAQARPPGVPALQAGIDRAIARLKAVSGVDGMSALRRHFLLRQLQSMRAYLGEQTGEVLDFDAESRALYDAVAPHHSAEDFRPALDRLNALLPGQGSLAGRYAAWEKQFVIPPPRLDAVFQAAITEARRRTLAHLRLPPGEHFTVEYVTDKPWSGYNWFQGDATSVIQVNTDLPIHIDRAIELAAHEGYPGHHVYNTLLEQRLVKDRGWIEYTVYPLYSPQSLIAEGSANFGVHVVFPPAERRRFLHDTLFPLAGLDPDRVDDYLKVQNAVADLSYAGNEAARRYLDGDMTAAEAKQWLETYSLMSPARAAQRLRFIEKYRAYVINYNLGQDLVRDYVNCHGGDAEHPEKRWQVFGDLLASPRLPSSLGCPAD